LSFYVVTTNITINIPSPQHVKFKWCDEKKLINFDAGRYCYLRQKKQTLYVYNVLLQFQNKKITKTQISKLVHPMLFWNNLYQVLSRSKDWKPKYINRLDKNG
jgi:hypothetical protein